MPKRNERNDATITGRRLIAVGQRISSKNTTGVTFVDVENHSHGQESLVRANAFMPIIGSAQPDRRAWFFVQLVTNSLTPWQAQGVALSSLRGLGADCWASSETKSEESR